MPRQREIPKINSVTVIYNGDGKTFDTFMESMINDYLIQIVCPNAPTPILLKR